MQLIEIIVYSLATYRIAEIIVNEGGPFNVFGKLQRMTGVIWDESSRPIPADNFFSEVLSCVYCLGVWIGIFFAVVSMFQFGIFIAMPFAISAGALIVRRYIDG